jgi:hypothetical protein
MPPLGGIRVKSREIGRTQTLSWWLGGKEAKTTENKIHWPPLDVNVFILQALFHLMYAACFMFLNSVNVNLVVIRYGAVKSS